MVLDVIQLQRSLFQSHHTKPRQKINEFNPPIVLTVLVYLVCSLIDSECATLHVAAGQLQQLRTQHYCLLSFITSY